MAQPAEKECVLALDLGSSSFRATAFDAQGRELPIGQVRRQVQMTFADDGSALLDADLVLRLLWECIDEAMERLAETGGKVRAVAMCTFVHSLMGLAEDGTPLTPLSTYADTSSTAEAEELKSLLNEREVHSRVGARFHPGYMPSKLLRMSRMEPDLFNRVHRWVTIGEFIELQLFGESSVSLSAASWSGALDRHSMQWDEPVLQMVAISSTALSAPATTGACTRQGLVPGFARRWPRLANVPWFPAIGDGAAANIGCGAVDSSTAAVTIGTTSAVRTVITNKAAQQGLPFGLFCYRVDENRLLPGGALSEGGNIRAWLKSVLHIDTLPDPEAALAAMKPDCHGLTVLPLASGERSMGWHGDARATVDGITLATTGLDLLRAGLEAVVLRITQVYDALKPFLDTEHTVVAGGGAVRASGVLRQMLADALGVEVLVPDIVESSARGAALLAWERLAGIDLSAVAPLSGERYHPDMNHHALYRSALQRQCELYDKLIGNSQ